MAIAVSVVIALFPARRSALTFSEAASILRIIVHVGLALNRVYGRQHVLRSLFDMDTCFLIGLTVVHTAKLSKQACLSSHPSCDGVLVKVRLEWV